MKQVMITAVRQTEYKDLQELYENPMEHACNVQVGMRWVSDGWNKPEKRPCRNLFPQFDTMSSEPVGAALRHFASSALTGHIIPTFSGKGGKS